MASVNRVFPKRVAIVEDDSLVLDRLERAISQDPLFVVRWKHSSFAEAERQLRCEVPDVLLTDLQLPDGDGADLIRYLHASNPETPVMVISVLGGESIVVDAIAAGASGYLLKDDEPIDILGSLHTLLAGGIPLSASIARLILGRIRNDGANKEPCSSGLTAREKQVLTLIARGHTYKEVAEKLSVSPHTIPGHIKAIYRKLEVRSRSGAVFEALQRKIIEV